jgi:hypothetical protein
MKPLSLLIAALGLLALARPSPPGGFSGASTQDARATRHLARMIVFGSFVTTKAEPNDVDVLEYWQVRRGGQRVGVVEIDLGAS